MYEVELKAFSLSHLPRLNQDSTPIAFIAHNEIIEAEGERVIAG